MKKNILAAALLGITAMVTTSSCRDIGSTGMQRVGQQAPKSNNGLALIRHNGTQCIAAIAHKIKA